MDITLAVPTYNSPDVLATCMASLFMNTDIGEFDVEVIIVNNGAPLNNVVRGERIQVHDIGRNLGWMGGVNFALDRARGRMFAMMNDDLLFIPASRAFWANMVDTLRVDTGKPVGLVGPSSNYVSGYQNAFWHSPHERLEVAYIIGMLSMGYTDELRDMGGLDDTLPGGDDIDLSMRMRLEQKKILVADRRSYVHHIGSQTGRREQPSYWDSQRHQAETYNAIMRKHGVKAYWDMLEWNPTPYTGGK